MKTFDPKRLPIVVWVGRFMLMNGYAWGAKNFYAAMEQAGMRVIPVDSGTRKVLGPPHQAMVTIRSQGDSLEIEARDPSDRIVVVIHERPDNFDIVETKGRCRLAGYTYTETEKIPYFYLDPMFEMDEMWTASDFNRDSFVDSGLPGYMVQTFPHCIDSVPYHSHRNRIEFPGARSFKFLNVVSNFNRKDLGALLRAYYSVFTAEDDVTLVIKTPGKIDGEIFQEQIVDAIKPDFEFGDPELAHVILLEEKFSDERMVALYGSCDAYVSTERGKGWDIPAMEAMASETACISVGWSANLEFMTEENSFLVRTTGNMVYVDPATVLVKEMYVGHRWAEIDEKDLRAKMRLVFDDKELRESVARRGRETIERDFSRERIAEIFAEKLSSYSQKHFREDARPVVTVKKKTSHWKKSLDSALKEKLLEDDVAEFTPETPTHVTQSQAAAWVQERRHLEKNGSVHRPSDYHLNRLAALKNRHDGERVVIPGNGANLNDIDLDRLGEMKVFGIDRIHKLFSRVGWRPDFLLSTDWGVLIDYLLELRAMIGLNTTGMTFFFPEIWRGLIPENESVYWFHQHPAGAVHFEQFASNPLTGLRDHGHSLSSAIQMAAALGFSEIYLAGVEANFIMRPGDRRVFTQPCGNAKQEYYVSAADDDPNHFSRDYHGADSHWRLPDPVSLANALRISRKALAMQERRLIELGCGGTGALELEYAELDELVEPVLEKI